MFDTTRATETSLVTVFNTDKDTSRSTSNATDTSIFERLTATNQETEVTSAEDSTSRYWDGDSWKED